METAKVSKFDRQVAKSIGDEATEAMKAIAKKYGLKMASRGGSYSSTHLGARFEFAVIDGKTGVAQTREVTDFRLYCLSYGLKPEDLGRTFNYAGRAHKVIGLKIKGQKYPIIVERDDGKQYKFPADAVANALKAKA